MESRVKIKPRAEDIAKASVDRHRLRGELTALLNSHCLENGSNTPDYILADYLLACLTAFDRTVRDRADWYGRMDTPGGVS